MRICVCVWYSFWGTEDGWDNVHCARCWRPRSRYASPWYLTVRGSISWRTGSTDQHSQHWPLCSLCRSRQCSLQSGFVYAGTTVDYAAFARAVSRIFREAEIANLANVLNRSENTSLLLENNILFSFLLLCVPVRTSMRVQLARRIWKDFFVAVNAIVFIVDVFDRNRYMEAKEELDVSDSFIFFCLFFWLAVASGIHPRLCWSFALWTGIVVRHV